MLARLAAAPAHRDSSTKRTMTPDDHRSRGRGAILSASLALALAPPASVADADPVALPPKGSPARHHLRDHALVAGGGALTFLVSETVLKPTLAPQVCRWCDAPAFDLAIRDALHWNNTRRADKLSYATGFAAPLIPLALVVGSGWRDAGFADAADDGLAVLEAGIATGLFDQVVKFTVGRQRPFVRFAEPGRVYDTDDDVSFFSGHTSFAFAIATASGTVASRHHYRLAPLVWATGLTFAAATGYLRIAADKHYASDVLIAAGIGSAFGVLLPPVLHDHGRIHATVVPTPGGLAIVGTF